MVYDREGRFRAFFQKKIFLHMIFHPQSFLDDVSVTKYHPSLKKSPKKDTISSGNRFTRCICGSFGPH